MQGVRCVRRGGQVGDAEGPQGRPGDRRGHPGADDRDDQAQGHHHAEVHHDGEFSLHAVLLRSLFFSFSFR